MHTDTTTTTTVDDPQRADTGRQRPGTTAGRERPDTTVVARLRLVDGGGVGVHGACLLVFGVAR